MTKYLQSPGAGDHYDVRKLSPDFSATVNDAKIIWISAVHKGNCSIFLGTMRISFGNRIACTLDHGRKLTGLADKRSADQWTESIFVLERQEGGQFKVLAGHRPFPAAAGDAFLLDPMIGSAAPIAVGEVFNTWNSATLRLDGSDAVDDFKMGTAESLEALPFELDSSRKLEVAYTPILDHIIAPRQATDLGGVWEAVSAPALQVDPPDTGWAAALVPDQHVELFSRDKSVVWFRRKFDLGPNQPGVRYELCFERVTDQCEIFLNGNRVGKSDDGFFPFRIDVSRVIREGSNEVIVKVYGPTPETVPGKRPQGLDWLYGSYRGIPYPVHLEKSGEVSVEDVFVIPRLEPSTSLEVRVEIKNHSAEPARIVAKAATAGGEFRVASEPILLAPGESRTVALRKEWSQPRLWQLHDPHLYNLDVEVTADQQVLDGWRQRFGFREIKVVGPDLYFNGVKTLHRRSSTIVYWGTEESRKVDIPLLRERGFNGYRLHLGPSLRVLRICDELGWLVSPEGGICIPHGDGVEPEFWPAAEKHLSHMVKAMRNSPSVFYWSLSNEFASYYMKGTVEEKAAVDTRMLAIGKKVSELDPTRIWTCSGDGELGGVGRHGDAPALSFHYAWQPAKQSNSIPLTVDWLSKGLAPWQGIVWDRTKPIMLSEDLYPPYGLNMPDGLTAWAGDEAYDPEKGAYQAWFDAIRMLAGGYYKAGVSVWNLWGMAETKPDNPLYALGQPMPDFLITPRELSTGASANSLCHRTFEVFNQTSQLRSGTLTATLRDERGDVLFSENRPLTLLPGKSCQEAFDFSLPNVPTKAALVLDVTLDDADSGRKLTHEKLPLFVYPALKVEAPAHCALVATDGEALKDVVFPAGRFDSLKGALLARPGSLVLVRPSLSAEEARLLRDAVSKGLKVLLLEADPSSALPVRTDAKHAASFAFIRSPKDSAIKGFTESELCLWKPDLLVSQGSYLKPLNRDCDVILDCGGTNGLQYSPLLRLYAGRGYYLLCQMPVVTSFAVAPVAPAFLQTLLSSLNGVRRSPGTPLALLEESGKDLSASLKRAGVPIAPAGDSKNAPLLVVDGRQPLSEATWDAIVARAQNGQDSLLDGMTPENARFLTEKLGGEISLEPSSVSQLLKNGPSSLSTGLSNGDLCWFPDGKFYQMISNRMNGKPPSGKEEAMLDGELLTKIEGVERPFVPTGLIRVPFRNAYVIISAIRWDKFLTSQPIKSRTVISQILRNMGCQIEKDSAAIASYQALDLRSVANRGFGTSESSKVEAWFGNPQDDLRYFPVNVTGYDPHLKMAQPPEKFPQGLSNFTGVDFQLIDPKSNDGRSCVVIPAGGSIVLPASGKKGKVLWFMGALDKVKPSGAVVAELTFTYTDGTSANSVLRAGVELNGYQYLTPASKGLCAWTGPTPSRADAVLWSWDVANPVPDKPISSISIAAKDVFLAIVAASVQN